MTHARVARVFGIVLVTTLLGSARRRPCPDREQARREGKRQARRSTGDEACTQARCVARSRLASGHHQAGRQEARRRCQRLVPRPSPAPSPSPTRPARNSTASFSVQEQADEFASIVKPTGRRRRSRGEGPRHRPRQTRVQEDVLTRLDRIIKAARQNQQQQQQSQSQQDQDPQQNQNQRTQSQQQQQQQAQQAAEQAQSVSARQDGAFQHALGRRTGGVG